MKFKLQQLVSVSCLSALLINTVYATNQGESFSPFLPGPLDQANMIAPSKTATQQTKTYILPATPATSQWGVFDSSQPPVLKINPGDSVVVETMAASNNQVVPGTTIEQIIQMKDAVADRGPHTVTGPIYIEGAEPGDILRIHFNKIVPRPYASNDSVPGKGLFPKEFPNGLVRYFYLDLQKMQMQFLPGIVIPLGPFPGVIAVARAKPGKYNSIPPGPFGGNMDLREMTQGTTLYLPVFMKGALLWTGDSHAGQGNGEIDLTAIETAFAEFNITVDLIKQKPLAWPRVETPTDWIAVGYDKDLNKAFDILKQETLKLIMEQRKVSQAQAQKIMLTTWNCPIAEVVNGVQGVYCMLPKDLSISSPFELPKEDNAKFFATYGKDSDLENAMKTASMAMLNKIVKNKNISRDDAYMLASFAMDCRIGPYQSGEKEVFCMLPKSLWVS
jgi:acetamidase/formamidase